MPKPTKKITNRELYLQEVKQLEKRIKKLQTRGYIRNEEPIPTEPPKRVTKKALAELEQYKGQGIYKAVNYVVQDTGEIKSGYEGRRYERQKAYYKSKGLDPSVEILKKEKAAYEKRQASIRKEVERRNKKLTAAKNKLKRQEAKTKAIVEYEEAAVIVYNVITELRTNLLDALESEDSRNTPMRGSFGQYFEPSEAYAMREDAAYDIIEQLNDIYAEAQAKLTNSPTKARVALNEIGKRLQNNAEDITRSIDQLCYSSWQDTFVAAYRRICEYILGRNLNPGENALLTELVEATSYFGEEMEENTRPAPTADRGTLDDMFSNLT